MDKMTNSKEPSPMAEDDKSRDLYNAMNTFYKLKNDYETAISDTKRKIAKKSHLSRKEKQDEFKRSKSRCINCSRSVGSIFEIKYSKDTDSRIAKAMCGDKVNPCPLNIEINLGKITNVSDDLKEYERQITDLKQQVIVIKNDLLFGYTTTDVAMKQFNDIKEGLHEATEMYESILVNYVTIYEKPDTKRFLDDKKIELYNIVTSIKTMMTDYDREQNTHYVNDAVTLYVTELLPLLNEYQSAMYPIMFTEQTNRQCTLQQKMLDPQTTELDLALQESNVIRMEVGAKIGVGKSAKPAPVTQNTDSSEYQLE